MAFVTQFDDDLGAFLRHSLGMALRAFRAILETGETFLSIDRPPLVKGLTADAKLPNTITQKRCPLSSL